MASVVAASAIYYPYSIAHYHMDSKIWTIREIWTFTFFAGLTRDPNPNKIVISSQKIVMFRLQSYSWSIFYCPYGMKYES